jgi:hypothetical protein
MKQILAENCFLLKLRVMFWTRLKKKTFSKNSFKKLSAEIENYGGGCISTPPPLSHAVNHKRLPILRLVNTTCTTESSFTNNSSREIIELMNVTKTLLSWRAEPSESEFEALKHTGVIEVTLKREYNIRMFRTVNCSWTANVQFSFWFFSAVSSPWNLGSSPRYMWKLRGIRF